MALYKCQSTKKYKTKSVNLDIKQAYRSRKKAELFLERLHFMWLIRNVTKGATTAISVKTLARMIIKGAFEAYRFGNQHPKLTYEQELLLRFAFKQLKY